MRYTVWAIYPGDTKPTLCHSTNVESDAEYTAERIFDEEGATVVMVHDGEREEITFALHEGREQALAALSACQGKG